MRAAVFHAAGSPLSIEHVPDPHPAAGEVAPQPMHTATVGFDELPEVFDSLRGASPHCKVLIDPAR